MLLIVVGSILKGKGKALMEFKVKRNNDKSYRITVKSKAGAAVDITGWTFYFAVKENEDDLDSAAIFPAKTIEAEGSDATAGIAYLPIDAVDTKGKTVGYYYCDLLVKDDQGKRKSSKTYNFEIQQEITDGDE